MAILALADDKMQRRASESLSADRATFDMYSASEWPADSLGASNGASDGADQEVIMITPPQCRMIWRQFQSDTGYIVQQVHRTAPAIRFAGPCFASLLSLAAFVPLQHLLDTSLSLSDFSASQTLATSCTRIGIAAGRRHDLVAGAYASVLPQFSPFAWCQHLPPAAAEHVPPCLATAHGRAS